MHIFHNGIGKPVHGLGGGGQGFAPTDIGAQALWLDAADSNTITQVDGNVSQWDDKSGQANHVVQSTASKQPLTGSRSLNGLNVLDLNGDSLINASFSTASSFTVICVYEIDTVSSMYNSVLMVDGTNDFQIDAGSNTEFRPFVRGLGLPSLLPASGHRPGPAILMANYDFGSGSAALYIGGGSALVSSASYTTSIDTVPMTFGIGRNRAANSSGDLDGAVAETLWYSQSLSAGDMNQIGNYLSTKWGVAWTNI